MQLTKKSLSILATLFALFIFLGSSFISPAGLQAYAAESSNADLFDKTNVIDDLEGSELDDVEFKLEDYSFDESKSTAIYSFVEFCYSYAGNMQDDFGLYIYVYNPKGLQFDTTSERNKITLRAGSDTSKSFHDYHLQYLNRSERENYEGLFYKFKINLSSAQKEEILFSVNSAKREYRISDMVLLTKGAHDVTMTKVGTSYYFEGYAGGYGPSGKAESTLVMTSEQKDTLQLEVNPTQYRPSGSNGKNEYTQDTLNSVYFAIPNEYITSYGEISAIHATWLNTILKPALVVGDQDAYEAVLPFLGVNIGTHNSELSYICYGDLTMSYTGNRTDYYYGYGYNTGGWEFAIKKRQEKYGEIIQTLYMMYDAGEDAESYTVTSKKVIEKLEQCTKLFGGELVNEKYSRVLFESIDDEFTDINITRETEYDLISQKISKSWWDKLLGGKHGTVTSSTTYDGIQAIYPIKSDDFIGTDAEISRFLYIDKDDVGDLKTYFDEHSSPSKKYPSGCTIYLLRYAVCDTMIQKAHIYEPDFWSVEYMSKTNAYFFQTNAYIGFRFIDVTFSNGEVSTVIPVAMAPIDLIPGAISPIKSSPPGITLKDIIRIITAILILALIGFAIYEIIKYASLKGILGGETNVRTTINVINDDSSKKSSSSSKKKK